MIRQLAAAHESGSPLGSSNSVNHLTSVRRSPMVLKRCSKGNVPTAVVSLKVATNSVAPFSSPRQLKVPLSPFASMLVLQSKPGSGVSATFAALICALDSQVARSARAVCAQQVGWVIVTSGALDAAEADGVGLAPVPPSAPRKRTPKVTSAKTSAKATRLAWAARSAPV